MKILSILALFSFFFVPPTEKIVIQTNAICGMCETRIEAALTAIEGVEKVSLDLVTKKVKVKYQSEMVTPALLRQAISAAGYDADEVPARPQAQEALPGCCKPDGEACHKKEMGGGR